MAISSFVNGTVPTSDQLNALATALSAYPDVVQSGTVTLTPTAKGSTVSADVTFDTPFTAAPSLIYTPYTTVPGAVQVSAGGLSATGFSVYLNRTDSVGATTISWVAAGTTS